MTSRYDLDGPAVPVIDESESYVYPDSIDVNRKSEV